MSVVDRTEVSSPPRRRPSAVVRFTQPRDLPQWPLYVFGLGFPPLWLAGLGFLFLSLSGLACAIVLIRRRVSILPTGWMLWATFLAAVLLAFVQLDSSGRIIGWVLRLTWILGATALLLYVRSATRTSIPDSAVQLALFGYWAFVVLGGWLGVVFPEVSVATPAASLIPSSIMDNQFVQDLVSPHFAEVQQPWGASEPFNRPSAPFAGANGWGCNAALLLPFMVLSLPSLTKRRRIVVAVISALGLVPALATLNRGLFIGVGVALLYVLLREAMAGHVRGLVIAVASGALMYVIASISGFLDQVAYRTQVSATNTGRASIYEEAFTRTLDSPLIGWGAPRPSRFLDISVGTQGHIWNVMFSFGFLALAGFVGFFLWSAWMTRHTTGIAFAAHVMIVVSLFLISFYGFDGPQLGALMLAVGLALRGAAADRASPRFRESPPPRPKAPPRSMVPSRRSCPARSA